MQETCHRCGEELPASTSESPFCPHCGAPQLYFQTQDQSEEVVDTTGAMPPPRPQPVEWKTAIRCALLVGLVAAVLSVASTKLPVISPLSSLWTISAPLIALGIYQKRKPQAQMDYRIGAKIGLVVGVVLVSFLAVSMTAAGLVARYALHSMAVFDAQLTEQLHLQIEHAVSANPESKELLNYLYSSEFKAGMMLASLAMVASFVIVLSTVGGALGGMLRRSGSYYPGARS
jgi:hypothetical protein